MSYLALARKWRPRSFSELVGQDHLKKALVKSLDNQRVHHAYLFSGTRGTGKTSTARLMAKALNCEAGVSSTPCLQCDACLSIEKGQFIDLIEIDAASKTRVEDTKDVLENIQYTPTVGRYKIYIIDEVHMLSQHSFNALLKTLEEPPLHVIFILATTDPQKLPITVLSRCLQFHLKHMTDEVISTQITLILNHEKLAYEEPAIRLLAKAAHGSMRDALSLLDQAIASTSEALTENEIRDMLGYTRQDYAYTLLNAIAQLNAHELIRLSRQIAQEGGQFVYVLEELIEMIHKITLQQSLATTSHLLAFSDAVVELASLFSPEELQLFYEIGLKALQDIHLAPQPLIGFEMTLLRMLTFKPLPTLTAPPLLLNKQSGEPSNTKNVFCHDRPVNHLDDLPRLDRGPQGSPSGIGSLDPADKPREVEEQNLPNDFDKIPKNLINTIHKKETMVSAMATNNPYVAPTLEAETTVDPFENEYADAPSAMPLSADKTIQKSEPDMNNWSDIIPQLKLSGLALNAAMHAEMVSDVNNTLCLKVAAGHQSLFTPNVIKRIEEAISHLYQNPTKLVLQYNKTTEASPAQQKQVQKEADHQQAIHHLKDDPFLESLHNEFSAEYVKDSIELI